MVARTTRCGPVQSYMVMGRTARACGAIAPTVRVDGTVERVSGEIATERTEEGSAVRVDLSTMQLHPGSLLVPGRSIAVWGERAAHGLAAHGLALEDGGRRG